MGLAAWFKDKFFSRPVAEGALPPTGGNVVVLDDGDNGGARWPGGLSGSGKALIIEHRTTRRNARNAMQDSSPCRAIVERLADTVADAGLRLELTPDYELLGITQEEADQQARLIEKRFDLWARDKKQHRREQMNFYQAQQLWQLFKQRDNDIFSRLYYESERALQNPLQFDFIEPDSIWGDGATSTDGAYSWTDGIETDDRGREIRYRVNVFDRKKLEYKEVVIPTTGRRSKRKFILHGFSQEYVDQRRGYSKLAHAIQEFQDLTSFSSSVIRKALNQATLFGFVEPSKDEDAINPFENILTDSGVVPVEDTLSAENTSTTASTTASAETAKISCYKVPEATVTQPGGMFVGNLPKGTTLKFPDLGAPADKFDSFIGSFAGYIAASMKVPLEVVLMKFGNNYSASRGTLLLFYRHVCQEREEMAADFLDPIVEMWAAEEIAAGRITLPGWSDPRMRAAWLRCNWVGALAPDIDPFKTSKAQRLDIETGLTNIEREARNKNGSNAAANIQKNMELYTQFSVPAPWTVSAQGPGG